MESMIERVARAMASADTLSNVDAYSWQLWPESKRDPYLMRARVAIGAMREPTRSMRQAGQFRYRDIPLGNGTMAQGL